ncbi:MAG: Mov34/MPN/PAD-1 family protein [Candidatus Hodarchaeales archaeon]|jgi:proteasome lid subunit RPN8/RPN11
MIFIPKDIYIKFLRFALENANPYDHKNWKECIGLVLGRINDDENINVTDIVPIGSGSAVFVDILDYEKVFSLISISRIDQGEVIVGWAHTHPGLGLFLSGTDINTQESYQRMHSQAFALVLDPTKITNDFSGFNIYRLDLTISQPYLVEYVLDDVFNFKKTKDLVMEELYPIPTLPLTVPPIISSDSSISWKNITIKIDGPIETEFDSQFDVNIAIFLPFRQFLRIEYQLETNDLIENPILIEQLRSEKIFHETLTSGVLGKFLFHAKNKGVAFIRITDFYLLDYKHTKLKLPEIGLKTIIK